MSSGARIKIREFIAARYPEVQIPDDEDLFSLGFINSLFAMELVMFIEKTFGITIRNDELRIDNFRTVSAMTALVERQAMADARG
jgi:methoxymalonate biosynthesis acyl carrier protein